MCSVHSRTVVFISSILFAIFNCGYVIAISNERVSENETALPVADIFVSHQLNQIRKHGIVYSINFSVDFR